MGIVNIDIVDCDSNVTITAMVNTGYQFVGWSDGGTSNPRTFHLTGDTTVIAYFDYVTYSVVGQPSDTTYGLVFGSDTSHYGDSVTLIATPNYGYHFTHWSDGDSNATRTITVTGDTTLMAYFEINSYQLTVLPNDSTLGTVTGSGTYTHGSQATVTATPAQGNRFDHWSDNSLLANYTFTLTSDMQLVAVFVPVDTVHVHDTTYIDVHDTTYVPVHDTTYIDVHDTAYVDIHDTTYIEVPYPVHDTTYIEVHDTTYINVPVHDTTYIEVHDTTYIDVPYPVHDTTYITMTDTLVVHDTTIVDNYIHDTTFVYDTTLVTDTIWLTEYLHDTVYLPQYIYDTVYIHDTVYVSIDEVDMLDAKIYARNGQIVVESGDGMPLPEVRVFDALGRMTQAIKQSDIHTISFTVQASGTYLVKIGNHPARRIVVIR